MADYKILRDQRWPETESDHDTAIFRDGKLVGEMSYDHTFDCCAWYYLGPDGQKVKDAYGDADMSPADLKAMIMTAYGD